MDFRSTKELDYEMARKRVEELKGYYTHLLVYIVVNAFVSVRFVYNDVQDGFTLLESVTDINTYLVWIFWGIGIALQTLKVFGSRIFLGRQWEATKIKEYMDFDKKR